MARAVTSVAAIVAVVAAVGSGINWIDDNLDERTVAWLGILTLTLLAFAWGGMAIYREEGRFFFYGLGTLLLCLSVSVLVKRAASGYLVGYVFATVALTPLAVELYRLDKASRRKCPDCCQQIPADANVCKHCGFRMAAKPPEPTDEAAI